MAKEPKTLAEMGAELAREGGILLGIFGVLEPILGGMDGEHKATVGWIIVRAIASILLMGVGVAVERWRNPNDP